MKLKKYNFITPDYSENNLVFNHNLNGSLVEENTNDILDSVIEYFGKDDKFRPGACYILPDGSFINVDHHGDVDEFIIDNYDVEPEQFLNTYLVDFENCVRCNDGRGKSFTLDRYITLPKTLTNDQIYSIEDWLEKYPHEEISISSVDGQVVTFNLIRDGISYIINRIKRYKNSNVLVEEESNDLTKTENSLLRERMKAYNEDIEKSELPDLSDENIISQEDAGINSLFIDLINDCWSIIDNYHSIIVTLDALGRHEFDETLKGLLEDRNKEVGSLQGILEILSPSSSQIELGKSEAEDQVAFDEVHEDFGLNESSVGEPDSQMNQMSKSRPYTIDDLEEGDFVVVDKQQRLNYPAILIPIRVMSIGVYGKDTFKGGQESGGEWDISHVKYVASSWEDANNWIEKHKGLTSKELDSVIKNEDFELYEAASVHADFSNKELTVKNIIEWFEKNHPKYVNRLRKEFNLPLDSILSDQLTKQDLYNLIRELRLEKSLCNDFGISESEYYSKYVDMKESFSKLTEEDERDLYLKAGLDPDIDRTPGTRDDGTYYDDKGFHWASDGHLLAEVNSKGAVIVPKDWEEWWT